VNSWDYLGLADSESSELSSYCCICILEPNKCSINIYWTAINTNVAYFPNNRVRNYQAIFQHSATVVLEHSEGKDVSGCHLRQDTEGVSNFASPPRSRRTTRRDEHGSTWQETSEDYSSEASTRNLNYKGWWFKDSPLARASVTEKPTTPWTVWWQAHVYVEEINSVETWWGYAGYASWDNDNSPEKGSINWSGVERNPFSVLPGVSDNPPLQRPPVR